MAQTEQANTVEDAIRRVRTLRPAQSRQQDARIELLTSSVKHNQRSDDASVGAPGPRPPSWAARALCWLPSPWTTSRYAASQFFFVDESKSGAGPHREPADA